MFAINLSRKQICVHVKKWGKNVKSCIRKHEVFRLTAKTTVKIKQTGMWLSGVTVVCHCGISWVNTQAH